MYVATAFENRHIPYTLLVQPEGLFNILCSPVTLSPDPAGLCWDFYCFICFSYDDGGDVDSVTGGDVHE